MATNPFAPVVPTVTAPAPFASPTAGQAQALAIPQSAPNTSSAYNEVDFDTDVPLSSLEYFPAMRKDEVTRIALILFNPAVEGRAPSPKFKHVQLFSKFYGANDARNVKKFLAPVSNPELMRACVSAYGEVKTAFGGIILHYDTDQYGNILQSGGFKLEAFVFNPEHWKSLKGIHSTWGLHNHDIIVTCTDPNFAKKQYQPAPESKWLLAPPEFREETIAMALDLYNGPLNKMLGAVKSEADIVAQLRQTNAPAIAATPANNPFAGGNNFALTPQSPAIAPAPALGRAIPGTGVGSAHAGVFSDLVAGKTQEVKPVETTVVETKVAEEAIA
jgi:hypothetical protein